MVDVTNAFFHCAKCIIRSKLWSADASPDHDAPPQPDRLLAEAMVEHGELSITVDEMQEIILYDEANRLY